MTVSGKNLRRTAVLLGVLALTISGVFVVSPPTEAAPGESQVPADNPDLVASCGLDILVILDESGSINDFGATDDVRTAFEGFTAALQNTGSRMAVGEFNYQGRMPILDYTPVTTQSIANIFEPYINNTGPGEGYNPTKGQRTNWEDGFRVGRYFAPPEGISPHLTVFITDGLPNQVNRTDNVTFDPGNPNVDQNQYELLIPLDQNQTTQKTEGDPAALPAVSNANFLKAAGSHILAVAVGQGLDKPGTLDTLQLVSGPDVYTGTGDFDISTDDVFRVDEFDQLEEALREAAFQLCAPSVNVAKLVDVTPDPGTDDAVPDAGWEMTADVAHPNGFTWVIPAGATGGTAVDTTDSNGFTNFQWTPNGNGPSTITVTEDDTKGTGYVNDQTETECVYRTPDIASDQPLQLTDSGDGFFSAEVPEESIVTCKFVNRALPAPSVEIEKSTNGADADLPAPDPGTPYIPIGDTVTWEYVVSNTGNVTLDIVVEDDQLGVVTCPRDSVAPGDSVTCEMTGTAVADAYANLGTVTGTDPFGTVVTDDDPSHYFGVVEGLDLEKFTLDVAAGTRDQADFVPGPFIPVGDDVTWEYEVTNTGNVDLEQVAVTDDQGVTVSCPSTTLAAGASMTCITQAVPAVAGQYENVATATGLDQTTGNRLLDSDPSHYFGEDASIDIEKATNGQDADDPTGPVVGVGTDIAWTYVVTNTGNVPLVNWSVTDDQGVGLLCPRIGILVPGKSITCAGAGIAQPGQYTNLGTVEATSPSGFLVSDEDLSHYLGVDVELTIEKSTNGEDADAPTGPFIEVGDPVTWEYAVTASGTDSVSTLVVVDIQVPGIAPVEAGGFNVGDINQNDLLDPGETWLFEASGTATEGQYSNLSAAAGVGVITGLTYDTDPSHYFGALGGIVVEKSTNGVDADLPADAPLVPLGDPVQWTYVVYNSSNTVVSDIALTDDQLGAVDCPQDSLDVGESMTCEATGTATVRGLYANVATVTGTDAASATVSDDDPSHYLGYVSAIDVEKSTDGEDADTPTGPQITVGDPVTWTYVVTGEDLSIRHVILTDDQGVTPQFVSGDTDGDDELDPGETWIYEATGTAVEGQYENLATVTGIDSAEDPLEDDDPSHYFGVPPPEPAIEIVKGPDQAVVDYGADHEFEITVTNTGNEDLTDVEVTDAVSPSCDRVIGDLAVAESVTYACVFGPVTGDVVNVAVVTGQDVVGTTVTDDDDAMVTTVAPTTTTSSPTTSTTPPTTVPPPYPPTTMPPILPTTGANSDRVVGFGLFLLLSGAAITTLVNRRKSE